jgi:hypothetical protein
LVSAPPVALVNKVLTAQTSVKRLTDFSNNQVAHLGKINAKLRKYQTGGDITLLQKTISLKNKRLVAAENSARRSLHLNLLGVK